MPHSINHVVLWCGLLALVAAAGGCQRRQTWDLAPVEGAVTKGGRPLANVQVIFLADVEAGTQGPRASGITDAAGHYRLRTDNGEDGATVGKYRVVLLDPTVSKGRVERAPRRPQPKEATQRLPPENAPRLQNQRNKAEDSRMLLLRYGRFNETPLRVEVRTGPQGIDLDVK